MDSTRRCGMFLFDRSLLAALAGLAVAGLIVILA